MFIRIFILTMLLATACTPSAIQKSAPPQDSLESTKEVTATHRATVSDTLTIPVDPTATPFSDKEAGLQKKFTQLAVKDLATRLSVDPKTIKVAAVESIAWPNAALGCPLVEKVYPQGKVAGFRIRLEAGGKDYDYHTDRVGQIILCPAQPDEPGLR